MNKSMLFCVLFGTLLATDTQARQRRASVDVNDWAKVEALASGTTIVVIVRGRDARQLQLITATEPTRVIFRAP